MLLLYDNLKVPDEFLMGKTTVIEPCTSVLCFSCTPFLSLLAANVHILDGNAQDLDKECEEYEKKIKEAGGVDLFIGGKYECSACTATCSIIMLMPHAAML